PPMEKYRAALALGAKLGARAAIAHIHDSDSYRASKTLRRFADMAAHFGLEVGLEFMPLSPACPDLATAVNLIRAAGANNIKLGIDALHLVRSGGNPAEVAVVDASLIGYIQICDGPMGITADYLT